MDPEAALGLVDDATVAAVAQEARARLWRAIQRLGAELPAAEPPVAELPVAELPASR
jgi:hypothetical protein